MRRIAVVLAVAVSVAIVAIQVSWLKDFFEVKFWVEKNRYHSVLHHQTIQVAPENPCEKCNGEVFSGCSDGCVPPLIHYFCAHCGYLKFVVPYSKVMSKPDHDELWKLKKYY